MKYVAQLRKNKTYLAHSYLTGSNSPTAWPYVLDKAKAFVFESRKDAKEALARIHGKLTAHFDYKIMRVFIN